ncbi:hypothetical protein [Bacillus sp. USDA818B3_A]|uniref:hypothetical protein n=1 Tax=Bacillus sp. USDA818B3_A TaxID=2698834 RepID=UPI00137088B5|nr:hypothetical protein [Bacillus sp. USDA818B3_A]
MDTKQLEMWIKGIKVRNLENADVEVIQNNSPFVMIGKGRQGAVFQVPKEISEADACVKVFGNVEDCEREYYALSLGKNTNLFPKVYAKGRLYIAMELVQGIDLREYLQSQPLTHELSYKLIEMLITFKAIGFQRIDHHKRQIFIQPDGYLKVIDVARTVWRDRVYPYPRKLLTSLGEKNKEIFLSHVQEMAPDLYKEWEHYIQMEEMSRFILENLLPERDDQKLKELCKKLITTNDEKQYMLQLEGLVQKVFKEEWIKVMLARGVDPDKVMKKIDEYWKNLENQTESVSERDRDQESSGRRYSGETSRGSTRQQSRKRFEGERFEANPKGGVRRRY